MLTTIREEQLLAKFAGEDVAVPQPCTRTEKFLAKMAGLDVQTPTPITREEQILNKIAEGGGGGGGDNNFSTAEVTFAGEGVGEDGNGEYFYCPIIIDEILKCGIVYGNQITEDHKYNVLTYTNDPEWPGTTSMVLRTCDVSSVSGDAEADPDTGAITIWGDCTITIVNKAL